MEEVRDKIAHWDNVWAPEEAAGGRSQGNQSQRTVKSKTVGPLNESVKRVSAQSRPFAAVWPQHQPLRQPFIFHDKIS